MHPSNRRQADQVGGDMELVWPKPASNWFEAIPVGNGRLGAMVFGGIRRSRLQVNDSTLWSGTPDGPAAGLADVLASGAGPKRLADVRQAILDEDYRRAEALLMSFEGRYSQEYLPFVDLWMSLAGDSLATHRGRTLNLDTGVVSEAIDLGDERTVKRRTWASHPAQALCVWITVEAGTADLTVELSSPLPVVHRGTHNSGLDLAVRVPVDGAPLHEPEVAEPLRYAEPGKAGYDPLAAAAVRIDTDGTVVVRQDKWTVEGMTYALVALTSSTSSGDVWAKRSGARESAGNWQRHRDAAAHQATSALAVGADELLRAHQNDLGTLLGATRLAIGARRSGTFDVGADILSGADEQLMATVIFQFGRYLLASASRPRGGPPANLQGIWNDELRPPWSSNYTLNINTQMNYWGAEAAGLSECHEPLFDLLDRLAATGRRRGPRAVRRARLGGPPQHRHVGLGAAGRHGPRQPVLGDLDDGRRLAVPSTCGTTTSSPRTPSFLRERAWPLLRGCPVLPGLAGGRPGPAGWTPSPPPPRRTCSLPTAGRRSRCRTRPPWTSR